MGIFDIPDPPPIEEQPLPVPTGLNAEEDARRFMALEFNGQRCIMCEQIYPKDTFQPSSSWCNNCVSVKHPMTIADQLYEARKAGLALSLSLTRKRAIKK